MIKTVSYGLGIFNLDKPAVTNANVCYTLMVIKQNHMMMLYIFGITFTCIISRDSKVISLSSFLNEDLDFRVDK